MRKRWEEDLPSSLLLSERAMDPQHESVLQGAELNPSLIELFYQNKSECRFINKIWFVPGILNMGKGLFVEIVCNYISSRWRGKPMDPLVNGAQMHLSSWEKSLFLIIFVPVFSPGFKKMISCSFFIL